MIYSSTMGWQEGFDTWLESGSGSPHHPNPELDTEERMEQEAAEAKAIAISRLLDAERKGRPEFGSLFNEIERDILSNGSVSAKNMADKVAERIKETTDVLDRIAEAIEERFGE